MSSLRLACVFQHNTTTDDVSSKFTVHDFKNVIWHNGAARTVTATGAIPSGSTSFTLTDCTSITTWINRTISTADNSAGFASRTFVKSISAGCVATLNLATTATIAAGKSLKIENSIPRSVSDGATTAASTTITSGTANFDASDVGLGVTGTNIPLGTTIASVTNATTAVMNNPADASGAAQVLSFGGSLQATDARTVNDVTYTATNKITSAAAKWKATDVGLQVRGTGIANPCYIASFAGTAATLSGTCVTTDLLTHIVTVGDASATAPVDGESAMDQGVQLDLNPVLVKGTRPCTDDAAEGFHVAGTWANPGSAAWFTGPFATQPAGTKAVGEIVVRTSAGVNYGAFVIEVSGAGDAVIGAPHYDVAFPNVPTGLAECPATATSPGLGFSLGVPAITPSVALLPQGSGRPGTGQLRATQDDAEAGATTTGFIVSDDVTHPFSFNRLCITPAGPPTIGFQCGTG